MLVPGDLELPGARPVRTAEPDRAVREPNEVDLPLDGSLDVERNLRVGNRRMLLRGYGARDRREVGGRDAAAAADEPCAASHPAHGRVAIDVRARRTRPGTTSGVPRLAAVGVHDDGERRHGDDPP